MNEIEYRTAELEFREESPEEGYVEGYAIRYDDIATISERAGRYRERFERGAFDGSTDVKLYREHKELIGHVVDTEDRPEGYWFRARIALTTLGKDTLALLRSGALSRFSVGFKPQTTRTDAAGVLVRAKAILREISVVERPAYLNSAVLAVREESPAHEGSNPMPTAITPEDLAEVRAEMGELSRSITALGNRREPDEAPIDQRSAGALLLALAEGDSDALATYQRAMEHVYDETQNRAYTGGTTADAPVKDAWVGDLTRIFDSSSGVLSDVFSTGTLPEKGMNIEFAELATNTVAVAEQAAQGDDLGFGKVTLTTRTAPVKTYGGYSQLSIQEIKRSTLPVLNRTLEALTVAAAARKKAVLRTTFGEVVATQTAIAANAGVVLLGATLAAGVAGNWEDALIDAAIKYDALNATPEVLIVSATVFKKLRSLTVSGERVFQTAKDNSSGTLNLPGLTGDLAGLPVRLDAGQAGDSAVFANGKAIRQYDTALAQLQDENIVNLSKTFSVYRFGAVAKEIPSFIVPLKLAAS